MADLRKILADEIASIQHAWSGPSPGWRQALGSGDDRAQQAWFARCGLEAVDLADGVAAIVWRDPADGTRHGWRWRVAADRLYLLVAHLHEDLAMSTPTKPDENGVRWWGVDDEHTAIGCTAAPGSGLLSRAVPARGGEILR